MDRANQTPFPDFDSVSCPSYMLLGRGLFMLASSPEIVQLRESNAANNVTEEPKFEDPGYRALVEENVKVSVSNIANDPIMQGVCLFPYIFAPGHRC